VVICGEQGAEGSVDQARYSEMGKVDLDIMVGGTIDNILMVEGEMKEVSEEGLIIVWRSCSSLTSWQ